MRQSVLALALSVVLLTNSAAGNEAYRLGEGDVVRVDVLGREDLSTEVTVQLDGYVVVPLAGRELAAGRSLTELSERLTERYRILAPDVPEALVSVVRYFSRRIMIGGEVRDPGEYGFQTMPNIWQALIAAGGATAQADLARVQILRLRSAGESESVISLDLSRGLPGTDLSSLPELQPKDTILVPSLVDKRFRMIGDTFKILGAVRTPGIYSLVEARTVIDALAVCGGSLPDANLKKTRLTRRSESRSVVYRLNVESHLYEGEEFKLEAGDTISIPPRGFAFEDFLIFLARLSAVAGGISAVIIAAR